MTEIDDDFGLDIDGADTDDDAPGLGRGLNALFDDAEPDDEFTAEVEQLIQEEAASGGRPRYVVGIDQLKPSKFQPRIIFKDETLNTLADSICQHGVLQPLLVRQDPEAPGFYEIIAGERRWRAAQKAGLHELPVVELELDELDAFKIALIENLQREDLDPIDEALGYKKLLEEYGQTQDDLAQAVGKSRPHITNMIRLLGLPHEVQTYLCRGDISMGHARALVNVEDAVKIAEKVIKQGLSVRQTEKLASSAKGTDESKKSKAPAPKVEEFQIKDPDTVALERDMCNALGMNVSIDSKNGKSGTISIEFKGLDQLDEVLHRLAHYPGNRLSG